MDTSRHDLNALFRQLGLPDSPKEIDAFIAGHAMPPGSALAEAPFWSAGQAAFLAQALAEDSEWTGAVDDLDSRLR